MQSLRDKVPPDRPRLVPGGVGDVAPAVRRVRGDDGARAVELDDVIMLQLSNDDRPRTIAAGLVIELHIIGQRVPCRSRLGR